MVLLLLCSVTAVGVFLERIFHLHRAHVPAGDFLKGISSLLRKGAFNEAMQECLSTPGPVPRVVRTAIQHRHESRSELREIIEEAAQIEVPKLERNLNILATIAYVAPLIGLLGTVAGLIEVFLVISSHGGYTTAAEIASGIYQALLTTAGGLVVGIPSYVGYNLLSSRVNAILHDMERAGIEISTLIKDCQQIPPSSSEPATQS